MNNVRYKTASLLKKTSMYRSRYVYNRHYLPTAVCLTYPPQLMPVSLLQQGPITPCTFFSNTESVKNSATDFQGEKDGVFFPANGTIQIAGQSPQKTEKAHFVSRKNKNESVQRLYLMNGGMSRWRAPWQVKGCEHKALVGMVKSLPISQNMFLCLQRVFKLIYLNYICLHIQRA